MLVAVVTLGITGIAYAGRHRSDSPLIMAFVERPDIRYNTLFAYFVDPQRGYYLPLRLPPDTAIVRAGHPPEDEMYYLTKVSRSEENRLETRLNQELYQYNVRTADLKSVYSSSVVSEYSISSISTLLPSPDQRFYMFTDSYQHAIVVLNRDTLETQIVWYGPEESINYDPRISWSPGSNQIAIYDWSDGPTLSVVDLTGTVINQFEAIGVTYASLAWLSARDLLLTSQPVVLNDPQIRVYDTITGAVNPFTENLHGRFAEYFKACNTRGDWLRFIQRAADNTYYMFTMNLADGELIRHDTISYELSEFGYGLLRPNTDCSSLIQLASVRFRNNYFTSNIYLTTLDANDLRKVVDNAIIDYSNTGNNMLFAKPNGEGSYTLFRLRLDGSDQIDPVHEHVPTQHAVQMPELIDYGWYVFAEDDWIRSRDVLPLVTANPLLYYNFESGKTRMVTPSDTYVTYVVELPPPG